MLKLSQLNVKRSGFADDVSIIIQLTAGKTRKRFNIYLNTKECTNQITKPNFMNLVFIEITLLYNL